MVTKRPLLWLVIGYVFLVALPILHNIQQEISSLSDGQIVTATVVRSPEGRKRIEPNAVVKYEWAGVERERELRGPTEVFRLGQSLEIVVDSTGENPRSRSAGYFARGLYLLMGLTLVYAILARLLFGRLRRRSAEFKKVESSET